MCLHLLKVEIGKTRQIIKPGGIFTLLKEFLCANRLIQEHFSVADKRTD